MHARVTSLAPSPVVLYEVLGLDVHCISLIARKKKCQWTYYNYRVWKGQLLLKYPLGLIKKNTSLLAKCVTSKTSMYSPYVLWISHYPGKNRLIWPSIWTEPLIIYKGSIKNLLNTSEQCRSQSVCMDLHGTARMWICPWSVPVAKAYTLYTISTSRTRVK